MNREAIKTYYYDFFEKDLSNVIPRNRLKDTNKIASVIGARRTGKSYLLYDKINELEKKGISRKNIVYLNFENPVLYDISYKDFKKLLEIFWELYPESKKLYLFIDEPQVIENWSLGIRALYDEFGFPIFITGSSSKLLSKEIATELRGRTLTYNLLPLTFKEYLKFKKFDFSILSTKNKGVLLNYLDEFLKYGSYPEIALENDNETKLMILKDYYDLVVYKDLVDRYKIKNTFLIKTFLNLILKSSSKELSINKIFNDIKSQGYKVSKNTLYEYLSMLEDSFFIHPIYNYLSKRENKSLPKIYLDNIGFYNIFSNQDQGKRLENAVLLHLLNKNFNKITYWKDQNNEVDFIFKDKAIQVCYEFDIINQEREIKSLLNCIKKTNLKPIIITKDQEKEIKNIKIIPAWKFLLEDEL